MKPAKKLPRFYTMLSITAWAIGTIVASAQTPPASTPLPAPMPPTLTPPSPKTPLIHGPKIFGVRAHSPFLYTIPATGDRPMTFHAEHLPAGLSLNQSNGQITGKPTTPGSFQAIFFAENALGKTSRPFKIVVGDDISPTPPMGWNSYNCFGTGISQERELSAARDIVKAGLDQHGWTYINMDGGWEGMRGGPFNAIQPDPKKFSDIRGMVNEIHQMGLKVGLYSSPWITTYGGQIGGSSNDPNGAWDHATMTKGPKNKKVFPFAIGEHHFFTNDAKQWADWGIDYVKWDWAPCEVPETKEMADALRASGRDIVFSLSNNATNSLFGIIGDMSKLANSWRIGGDIRDSWPSIMDHGFHNDKWAPYARPGHWNDPDMFEVGANGGGKPKRLTADEQYTHVSQWCLLSAPMLLGCDLDYLDAFTIGLLSNDEVIDVDQDELGKQATNVATKGKLEIYAKPLSDGSWAVGLFNLGDTLDTIALDWHDIKISGRQTVRDLWRQTDLGIFTGTFSSPVNPHGVVLIKVSPLTP
jgi:alpha-galactosidase